MAGHVAGWLLHPADRDRHIVVFPAAYSIVVAYHFTKMEGFVVHMADDRVEPAWAV
jgi:hypothetical protein